MGANKLLRSMDKGENFIAISEDLTTGGKKGNIPYGTLTSISESPFQFGFIYTGSDDGYVNVTTNGGGSWVRISDNLPQNLWVSRVIASQHEKERVYVALNGYRSDDFKPYIFVSENMGKTWESLNANLPNYPINVVKEDPEDENMLYLGTDNEAYVSFDKGKNWQLFSNGIPKVAVHDLIVQANAKDLVIGTHGRSIYKANITSLQQFNKIKDKNLAIFEIPTIRYSSRWGSSWGQWYDVNLPSVTIPFYAANDGSFKVIISTEDTTELNQFAIKAEKGFNYFEYDVSVVDKKAITALTKKEASYKKAKNGVYYLPKGTYFVKIGEEKQSFEVK